MHWQLMKRTQHSHLGKPFGKLNRAWIGLVLSIFIVIGVLLQQPSPAQSQASDEPCIHGMRIVGENAVYLSHMGLFNKQCHRYQGLFEVSLEGPNNPQQIYLNAQRKDVQQNEYTIEPTEEFILPSFAAAEKTSFRANLYRGQYERSATRPQMLAKNVNVRLKRVVFFRPFQRGARQPAFSEYLLFGNGTEQLAAHLITAPPDFDQVVALKTPLPLTDTELAKAIRIVLPNRPTPDPGANLSQALKPGSKPAVQVDGRQPNKVVEVGFQYFLETADYKRSPAS